MIKLKKIVATVVAAAMCLGMGITSFAAVSGTGDFYWNSPNYPFSVDNIRGGIGGGFLRDAAGNLVTDPNGHYIGGIWATDVRDKDGNTISWQPKDLPTKTFESINSEDKVRELFEGAGYNVEKDWDLIPVVAFTADLDNGLDSDGAYVWFDAEELGMDPEGFSANEYVYVLRETVAGSGEWEVVEAQLVQSSTPTGSRLQFKVQMTNSNQSFVVVRVMDDGRTIRLIDKKNNTSVVIPNKDAVGTTGTSTSSSATASPQASPKTGEF